VFTLLVSAYANETNLPALRQAFPTLAVRGKVVLYSLHRFILLYYSMHVSVSCRDNVELRLAVQQYREAFRRCYPKLEKFVGAATTCWVTLARVSTHQDFHALAAKIQDIMDSLQRECDFVEALLKDEQTAVGYSDSQSFNNEIVAVV